MTRRLALASTAAVVMACLAACGGSSETSPTSSAAGTTTAPTSAGLGSAAGSSSTSAVISAIPSPSVSVPAGLSAAQIKAANSAVKGYLRFIEVEDEVLANPQDRAYESLSRVAVFEALEDASTLAAEYAKDNLRTEGKTRIIWVRVENISLKEDARNLIVPVVTLRACESGEDLRPLDSYGNLVTKSTGSLLWSSQTLMSYYPKVEGGTDGWFASRYTNERAERC